MPQSRHEKHVAAHPRSFTGFAVFLILLALTARCTRSGPVNSSGRETTLRIGVPDTGSDDALNGTRQLRQILSTEGLARIGEDGRPVPGLAEGWTTATDGLSMKIRLRASAKFHDGSLVDAATVSRSLERVLPQYLGPAFKDVDYIRPNSVTEIQIGFRRPSQFLVEALEAPIQKPGSPEVGTGPYMTDGQKAPTEMRANPDYYLGPPVISRINLQTYPNVRSAWAEMLRDKVDFLYEVGQDALDSLTSATNVSVFTYIRHYQYVLIFNTKSPPLRSPEVRRALNKAVDTDALSRDAFDGHAMASFGPIWPRHWAVTSDLPRFSFDPKGATKLLRTDSATAHPSKVGVRFKCLVRPALERIALVLKQQLEAVGVEMVVQEAPLDSIMQAIAKHEFDAVLAEVVSGPSLFRPYVMWHSGSTMSPAAMGSHQLDLAFDQVRNARNDAEYRAAVAAIQKAVVDDPPAIFLAWEERARAVSKRFQVPAEPGRDVLPTLRTWRPASAERAASRN